MERDAPIVVKCVRVRGFVVGCDLPASRLGKVASKDIEVGESETKDFESNFE
jgi:hypothetical protein